MNTTIDRSPLMDLAAEHLVAAANHVEPNACGDPTSPWHHLAGQIRLVASGVSPVCHDEPSRRDPAASRTTSTQRSQLSTRSR